MGLVTMGAMSAFEYSIRASQSTQSQVALASLRGDLLQTLSEPGVCETGFTASVQNFDETAASGSGMDVQVQTLSHDLVQAGSVLGDSSLKIDKLYLANSHSIGTHPISGEKMYAVDLILSASPVKDVLGTSSYRPMKVGSLVVFVDPSSNRINTCARDPGAAVPQTCASLGGAYDSSTGLCQNMGGTGCGSKIHGEIYDEACPAGYTGVQSKQCWNGTIKNLESTCVADCGSLHHGDSETQACPAGTTGGVVSYQCWNGDKQMVANTCVPIPAGCGALSDGQTTTRACSSGFGTETLECNNGTLNVVGSSCLASCDGSPHGTNRTLSCPAGKTGYLGVAGGITQTCVNGTWTQTADNCYLACGSHSHGSAWYEYDCPMHSSGRRTKACDNGTIKVTGTACKYDCYDFSDRQYHPDRSTWYTASCPAKYRYTVTGVVYKSCNNGTISVAEGCTYSPNSCFTSETLVSMADGSQKEIRNINIGDLVVGAEGAFNLVVGVEQVTLNKRDLISINAGPFFFTPEHPFMTTEGWKSLDPSGTFEEHGFEVYGKLKVGDVLVTEAGLVEIKELDEKSDDQNLIVYNLILNGNHTYFANSYLVHNKR